MLTGRGSRREDLYVFANNEEGKFLNDVKLMNDEAPPMYVVQKNGYTGVAGEEKD